MAELEKNIQVFELSSHEIASMIVKMEQDISTFKTEYAALIVQVETIKSEIDRVAQKVGRSLELITSLSAEKIRWEVSSKEFKSVVESLPGDCLLSAGFLVYCGEFDQVKRESIVQKWQTLVLGPLQIAHRDAVLFAEAHDRDQQFSENIAILNHSDRFVWIVDPAEEALEYIRQVEGRKAILSSFLDDAFVKHLESALRFGNTIIIQDAEMFDPVVLPVLKREYAKIGGRLLVRLGKVDIDLNPAFKMILVSRERENSQFATAARVINFAMTKSGIAAKCLSTLLKKEKPRVFEEWVNVKKLQAAVKSELTGLEKQLLDALNSNENILENEDLLKTLEELKRRGRELSERAASAQSTLTEIESINSSYSALVQTCCSIYFLFELLRNVNPFYQFSLDFFFDIFYDAIEDAEKKKEDEMLRITMERVGGRGMRSDDRVLLAVLLAHIKLTGSELLPQLLMKAKEGPEFLKLTEMKRAEDLIDYSNLEHVVEGIKMIRECRIDRFNFAVMKFARSLLNFSIGSLEWNKIIGAESKSHTPIAICSVSGVDMSSTVEVLARREGIQLHSVAMGGTDSIATAESVINQALKGQGNRWVLLKNVHLISSWLSLRLSKKLAMMRNQEGFRLILTLEMNERFPVEFLMNCRVVCAEPTPGIKANLRANFRNLSARLKEKSEVVPKEEERLAFMLAFLMAVIQERLQYVPIGWTKAYEFSDTDLDIGFDIIHHAIQRVSQGRTNISPDKIPFESIRSLLAEFVFGSRLESEFDRVILQRLIERYVSVRCFEIGFSLAPANSQEVLVMPDSGEYSEFIERLPDVNLPDWAGLYLESERVMLTQKGSLFRD
jgi:dynein heavy chain 1, cytosolic